MIGAVSITRSLAPRSDKAGRRVSPANHRTRSDPWAVPRISPPPPTGTSPPRKTGLPERLADVRAPIDQVPRAATLLELIPLQSHDLDGLPSAQGTAVDPSASRRRLAVPRIKLLPIARPATMASLPRPATAPTSCSRSASVRSSVPSSTSQAFKETRARTAHRLPGMRCVSGAFETVRLCHSLVDCGSHLPDHNTNLDEAQPQPGAGPTGTFRRSTSSTRTRCGMEIDGLED